VTPGFGVLAVAGSALFQDRGRELLTSGVPVSGAFDRLAHGIATGLVGGGPHEASLEVLGRVVLRARVPCVVAVAGDAAVTVEGGAAPAWTSVHLRAGHVLDVSATSRAYVAVAGGFRPEPVLGSRSTCLIGPLGPAPVRPGDDLPVGAEAAGGPVGDCAEAPVREGPVRVVPGPHLPFTPGSVHVVESSRIGVRLASQHVSRAARGDPAPVAVEAAVPDLPSLGVLPGAVQALPSGEWMVLGPDCGTMGGYPVVGVVATADLDRWAHLLPGDEVRLSAVEPAAAPRVPEPRVLRLSSLA